MEDYTGKIVPTAHNEIIKVNFMQTDGEENVKIMIGGLILHNGMAYEALGILKL